MPRPSLTVRKVSVSKNVTSEIRQKAPKAYPFFLKSVMCSFWRMAFASTYNRFSLVTKKQFKFSNTTLRWNFPQTFCVLNQQPFLLFVKILCALSTDTYTTSSKTLQAVPSLPSLLQRFVWQYFFNTCPKDLRVISPDAADEA